MIKRLLVTILICIANIFLIVTASGQNVLPVNKLATHYFGNDKQWYIDNVPFFECSDSTLQNVYYYRWKTYKAHIRNIGKQGYAVTEFLDNVGWDRDPYSVLNDATGFHIMDGRWIKNNKYLNSYIDLMTFGGGNDLHFSESIADAIYKRYLVNSDTEFIKKQLDILVYTHLLWYKHFDGLKKLYYIEPILDATEYTIASIDASDGKDGFAGGHSFRPTINSYMYANDLAISNIARLTGKSETAKQFSTMATGLKDSVQKNLWNDSFKHFTDRFQVTNPFVKYWDFIRGREIAGYAPWYFNLPDDDSKYNAAWAHLMDTTKFLGKYGFRTVEPSYQYYMKQYRYDAETKQPECQWNGPNWPYLNTIVIGGMINLLNNYHQEIISNADFIRALQLYAGQHYRQGKPDIEEDYNPDNGKVIVGLQRSHHYNHSGFIDLIITGLCGLRPREDSILEINPLLNEKIKFFCIENISYHGKQIGILYDSDGTHYKKGKGLFIFLDDSLIASGTIIKKETAAIGTAVVMPAELQDNVAFNLIGGGYPLPEASVNTNPDSLLKAIDGRMWDFEEIPNYWSTYGSTHKVDWYSVNFGKPVIVNNCKAWFYSDGKAYTLPKNAKVDYYDGKEWKEVQYTGPKINLVSNTLVSFAFKAIKTSKIRIRFENAMNGFYTALSEVEAY